MSRVDNLEANLAEANARLLLLRGAMSIKDVELVEGPAGWMPHLPAQHWTLLGALIKAYPSFIPHHVVDEDIIPPLDHVAERDDKYRHVIVCQINKRFRLHFKDAEYRVCYAVWGLGLRLTDEFYQKVLSNGQ